MELIRESCDGVGLIGLFLCSAVCFAPPIILTVYLGIYAFENPDNEAWYGIVDQKKELFANEM